MGLDIDGPNYVLPARIVATLRENDQGRFATGLSCGIMKVLS